MYSRPSPQPPSQCPAQSRRPLNYCAIRGPRTGPGTGPGQGLANVWRGTERREAGEEKVRLFFSCHVSLRKCHFHSTTVTHRQCAGRRPWWKAPLTRPGSRGWLQAASSPAGFAFSVDTSHEWHHALCSPFCLAFPPGSAVIFRSARP